MDTFDIKKFNRAIKAVQDLDEKFNLVKQSTGSCNENRVTIKNNLNGAGFVGMDFASGKEEKKDKSAIINILSIGKPSKNFIVIPSDAVINFDERSMVSDKLEEIFKKLLPSLEADSVSQSVELIDLLASDEQQQILLKRELKNCRNPLRKQQIQREIQDLKRLEFLNKR